MGLPPVTEEFDRGNVVRLIPTGALGVVKRAGSRSSKTTFHLVGGFSTRQVKNRQLTRKAARL